MGSSHIQFVASVAAGIIIICSLFLSGNASASIDHSISIGDRDEGYSPFDVVVNHATNIVYATSPNSNTVAVIDASTNELIDTISVGITPVEMAVNQNTNVVYVANGNSGTISVINGSANNILKTLKVTDEDGFYSIGGIAVNEKTNKVYVLVNNRSAEPAHASILIIDGLTNDIEQTFKVADLRWDYDVRDSARGIAINSKTNMIYITMIFGSLHVIDGSNNKVLTNLAIGRMPTEVEVNEETNSVYISDFGSQLLFVMDGLTNSIKETVWIGYSPQDIAIDSITDTIYVTGPGLSIINGSSNQVESRVEIEGSPNGVAINQNNRSAYVASWQSDSIFVVNLDDEKSKGSMMPLSSLRQNTASGKYIVELGWEFTTADNVVLLVSFFDGFGRPFDHMQYDLVIRDASNGEVVQEFKDQIMIGIVRHDITFEKGDDIQIEVIIKEDGQESALNDKVTFDLVVVPEFSSSILIATVTAMSIGIATLKAWSSKMKI